jgi:hypothetical protein
VLVHNSHFDLRFGSPDTGLYSWATRKELPGPGGRIGLFRQPVHDHGYGGFEGALPAGGYGAGTVRLDRSGKVKVLRVSPRSVHLEVPGEGGASRYVLVQGTKGPKSWLLVNTTAGPSAKEAGDAEDGGVDCDAPPGFAPGAGPV